MYLCIYVYMYICIYVYLYNCFYVYIGSSHLLELHTMGVGGGVGC